MLNFSPRIKSEDGGLVLESALNKNLTFRTRGSGKVNINDQDLTSLAVGLLGQPEEHSGARLAARLESVENSLTGLTADGDGRISAIESSVADLKQLSQQSQDFTTKYRQLRRQVSPYI